jgi:hypothetical protein
MKVEEILLAKANEASNEESKGFYLRKIEAIKGYEAYIDKLLEGYSSSKREIKKQEEVKQGIFQELMQSPLRGAIRTVIRKMED